jgi:hypothetical protein
MKFAELTQVALLGTERQNISLPVATTALGHLESQMDVQQRERALLSLAALNGLHERIGSVPGRDPLSGPAPCPVEQQSRVNERAGSLLLRLLAGEFAELLPEWLALAAQANRLAPPEALPTTLQVGANKTELREAILPVLGERGRWLAAQNPEWTWVVGGTEGDDPWHLGDKRARLLFLQRLRRTDPAHARELLMGTWKEETPEDRAAFIAALEKGLVPEDEPFLESALDDQRKEVRRIAAILLARLPDSGLVRRVTERVKPLLKFIPGSSGNVLKLKKAKPAIIEVILPTACDPAMQRDGIEPKPPAGLGEKAWWLIQMLEIARLDRWPQEWQVTREDILAASESGEWKKELFEAWTRAAARQKNAAWAEALFVAAIEGKRFDKLEGLFAALPPVQGEARLMVLLTSADRNVRNLHGALMVQSRHAWSPEFSRFILAFMRQETAGESGDVSLRLLFKSFAPCLAPETLAEAANGWPTDAKGWEFWTKGVDEFLAVAQFRSDLHHALNLKP